MKTLHSTLKITTIYLLFSIHVYLRILSEILLQSIVFRSHFCKFQIISILSKTGGLNQENKFSQLVFILTNWINFVKVGNEKPNLI